MQKFKIKLTDARHKLTGDQASNGVQTHTSTNFAWPPQATGDIQVLGQVRDCSGRDIRRDHGCSFQLGDSTYMLFGDSYSFDLAGQFQGVANNTVALIPNGDITKSQCQFKDDKLQDFIPYTPEEAAVTEQDQTTDTRRITLRAYGGVLPCSKSKNEGFMWFEKLHVVNGADGERHGVGIAKVRASGTQLNCQRLNHGAMLFPQEYPNFGCMGHISLADGWTYLPGGKGIKNYLCRIRADADPANVDSYQYLGKSSQWLDSFNTLDDLEDTLLENQAHGELFYDPDRAPGQGQFLWIGCDKFLSGSIYMGCAARIEGPWDVRRLCELPEAIENSNHRYCVYPHLWASNLGKGEIVITWSDDGQMGARVIAGKLCLKTL